jgi:thiol:disulfide interchange protein
VLVRVCALLVAVYGGTVRAQEAPVTWSAAASAHGDTATFTLTARIATGWHLYSLSQGPGGPVATRVSAMPPARIVGTLGAPAPMLSLDRSFGIVTETYEDAVDFRGTAILRAGSALTLRVLYQTCDDRVCLPPATADVSVRLSAAVAAMRADRPAHTRATTIHSDVTAAVPLERPGSLPADTRTVIALGPGVAVDGPWGSFLWLAATTAVLALLTPCVFPMVPITVAYFTRERRTRGDAVREALTYALGIVAAFVVLGAAVAAIFGAASVNRLAANPWLNILLGAAFVAFALSLMSVFTFRVPHTIVNRVGDIAARGGRSPMATIAAALTFTLTSFTCTAPFVGTLLVAGAEGSWSRALAGIAVFAAVFALPFVALAAAPALLMRIPRSGAWMQTLKVVLGVAELCAAVKFFANADQVLGGQHLTRGVVLLVWAALCIGLAIFLVAARGESSGLRPQRVIPVVAITVLAIWLLLGAAGRPLGELEAFMPATVDDRWITDDYDAALRQSVAMRRPVFVDFTGYTCTNCRWMETNMFTQPAVARALDGFVRLRLYTDGRGAMASRAQAMQRSSFHTVALPLYAVVGSDGRAVATFLGMTRDRQEFVDFLRRAGAR